ncbi:MAG: hypothetical protein M9894_16195 [Planctomycetes bacterium]|nr:hypothetical protein [Planctomycetota bacterium]
MSVGKIVALIRRYGGAGGLESARVDLVEDLELTKSSPTVLVLNPDGAHDVLLPAPQDAAMFVLANVGGATLSVKDGSTQLTTVAPMKIVRVYSDATFGWIAGEAEDVTGETVTAAMVFSFGEDSVSADGYLQHGAGTHLYSGVGITTGSTLNHLAEAVIGTAGRFSAIEGQGDNPVSVTLKMFKNGAEAETITLAVEGSNSARHLHGEATGATPFAVGDRVAFRVSAISSSPNTVAIQALYDVAKPDAALRFGTYGQLNMQDQRYLFTNITAGGTHSTEGEVGFPAPVATTIRRLLWTSSAGDATSKVSIYRNASTLHEEVTLTGQGGVVNLSTPLVLAPGETANIRHHADGTNPTEMIAVLEGDGLGHLYSFGGNASTTSNRWYRFRTFAQIASDSTGGNFLTQARVVKRGVAQAVGWFRSLTNETTIRIYKNGALAESIDMGANARSGAPASTPFERGDVLEMHDNDSVDAGVLHATVLVA